MQNFDDVWFTYKARIAAELRLKNNDIQSQILLVWYALVSSAASIVAVRYEKFAGPDTDIYTAILSVALLVISMLVANRDYRGRALQLRANHIALKKLHDDLKSGAVSAADKPAAYSKLLAECENHSSYDDRYFRVLNGDGLTTRRPTIADYFFMSVVCLFRVISLVLLYILPFTVFLI